MMTPRLPGVACVLVSSALLGCGGATLRPAGPIPRGYREVTAQRWGAAVRFAVPEQWDDAPSRDSADESRPIALARECVWRHGIRAGIGVSERAVGPEETLERIAGAHIDGRIRDRAGDPMILSQRSVSLGGLRALEVEARLPVRQGEGTEASALLIAVRTRATIHDGRMYQVSCESLSQDMERVAPHCRVAFDTFEFRATDAARPREPVRCPPSMEVDVEREQCARGEPDHCRSLADRYREGRGVVADNRQAADFARRAADGFAVLCQQGQLADCNRLGILLTGDFDRPPEYRRAMELYRRACDGGVASACSNIGQLYERGWGVARDLREARRRYHQGCTLGDTWGCDHERQLR